MLRPYKEIPSFKALVASQKRRLFPLAVGLVVVVALFAPSDLGSYAYSPLRRLAVQCVHNVYAHTIEEAFDVPRTSTISANLEIPSYIGICQEWMRRATADIEPTYTQEDDSVCMDWSSPHYRMMEIIASSILDRVNGLSRYRHDCFRSRTWDEAITGVDRTTVQQAMPVARLEPDTGLISLDDMKAQCKVCLLQFDPATEKSRVKSKAATHCFAFPSEWTGNVFTNTTDGATDGVRGRIMKLPEEPEKPNVMPISTVYKQIRSRIGYVGKIFSNVTDSPPAEAESGIVIYIDPNSIGIDKEIYPQYFEGTPTSITVLSSVLCASAYLSNGVKCTTYAEDLVDYFQGMYSGLTNTGYKNLNGIKFQMAASSAAAISRMVLAKHLICPPNTYGCMLPAMSKINDNELGIETKATLLISEPTGVEVKFFTVVGHGNVVTLELLAPDDLPSDNDRRLATIPSEAYEQKYTSNGQNAAPEFMWVNNGVDSDGFYTNQQLADPVSRTDAATMSDAYIYSQAAAKDLPDNSENPNVYEPRTEIIPSKEYAQQQKDANEPINWNYGRFGTTTRVTDEMMLDEGLGFTMRALTDDILKDLTTSRADSQKRIVEEVKKSKAKQMLDSANANAFPSMEMEVFCPEVTDDGFPIEYDKGSVKIEKNRNVMVSDGAGTAIFDKDSLKETVHDIPRDADGNPYTHVYDPVTEKNITIKGTNITVNKAWGGTERDPVGLLLVDNLTDPYTATFTTEGGSGTLRAGNQQKTYSGSIISTGKDNVDDGNVVRHGRGYAIKDYQEPGEKRSIDGHWNQYFWERPESPYTSKYDSPSDLGFEGTYARQQYKTDERDLDREIVNGLQPDEIKTDRRLRQNNPNVGNHVAIMIPEREFKFGAPEHLRNVCERHKDKVVAASVEHRRTLRESTEMKPESTGDQQSAVVVQEKKDPNEQIAVTV